MCVDATDLLVAAPRPDLGTEPPEVLGLEPVDELRITSLVDNSGDLLAGDQGPARRTSLLSAALPTRSTHVQQGGEVPDVPLAEHGFSALVELTRRGRTCRVLFDAGLTPDGLVTNMRRLDIDPTDIDVIVLSHGHFDHTTGLDGFIRAVGRVNLPVLIHPHFWHRRRIELPGREHVELPTTSRRGLVDAGFDIIERPEPSFLLDGALLVTGEIDRTTPFERGFPVHQAHDGTDWRPDPLILDDQALIAHVRGRGLVVMTGCGHAGVVNILRYARRLTGVDRIHAVLGGFHLAGPLFAPIIPPTVDALEELAPDVIVPAHCTGWAAMHRIATALPDAFIPNAVGTRYDFATAG